jgi:hypothetical protein
VGTTAKIDEGTTSVDGGGGTIGNLIVNDMNLVRVMLEHF